MKYRKLAVRVFDFEGTQHTEVFDISGLEGALKPYHRKYFGPSEEEPDPAEERVDPGVE